MLRFTARGKVALSLSLSSGKHLDISSNAEIQKLRGAIFTLVERKSLHFVGVTSKIYISFSIGWT